MRDSRSSTLIVSLLVALPMLLTAQRAQENLVPLKNWATPLYWQPNQIERISAGQAIRQGATPELQFSSNEVSNGALTFIAITPCRLVDTRGGSFNGISPFSGPSIPANGTITIPVQSTTEASTNTAPAPCGVIPTIAQAYSINLTVVPHAPGTVDYISLWPAGGTQPFVSTLDDPQGAIISNSAIVPAGTPTGGISVFNAGPAATDVIIDMNGYYAPPTVNFNTAIGNGALADNTTGVGNTAVGAAVLANNTTGNNNTASGQLALQGNTTGGLNTATGSDALQNNSSGNNNTATGQNALQANTTGSNNTATGQNAMQLNTTGCCNVAMGQAALNANTTGSSNVALGGSALQNNTTASANTAVGQNALFANTTGNSNTAVGQNALNANTTGTNNVALGHNALAAVTTSSGDTAVGTGALNAATGTQDTAVGTGALANGGFNSIAIGWAAASNTTSGANNNIHIGNSGASGDNNTIQIGTQGTQTSFFAAGIRGITTATNDAIPVLIGSNGQLGTVSSSRRFKEDIQDMGDSSSGLLSLRPVTFRYKQPFADGSKPIEYGLIAEEVAEVYPDLVAHSVDGQIETVKYQVLDSMLLNEVKKQAEQIRSLQEQLSELKAMLSATPNSDR